MKQAEVFLASEGDAYFERNHPFTLHFNPQQDLVIGALKSIYTADPQRNAPVPKILEIGCGEALRLSWLQNNSSFAVVGLDPSSKAVTQALQRGVTAHKGTADALPFARAEFDVVIFGFCLYLCDPDDLFKIAQEADRVLKRSGWIIIHDFFSPVPIKCIYRHYQGVYTRKMDYRKIFDWHPAYHCFSHQIYDHSRPVYTDDTDEWVALSVMRKHLDDK